MNKANLMAGRSLETRRRLVAAVVIGIAILIAYCFWYRRQPADIVWTTDVRDTLTCRHLAWADGTVFAGTYGGLIALNDATGAIRWRSRQHSPVYSITVATNGTRLYVGRFQSVEAVDITSGETIWTFSTSDYGECTQVKGSDTVFAGGINAGPRALSPTTGIPIWKTPITAIVSSNIAVGAHEIYFCSPRSDAQIIALDKTDGHELWRSPHGGAFGGEIAIVGGRVLVVEGSDSCMYALDTHDGHVLWKYALPYAALFCYPVDGQDGSVYITESGGTAFRLRISDGSLVWKTDIGEDISASPTLAGERLYVGAGIGDLYVLSKAKGNEELKFRAASITERLSIRNVETGECTTAPTIVRDGSVFLGTTYGKVYRIRVK